MKTLAIALAALGAWTPATSAAAEGKAPLDLTASVLLSLCDGRVGSKILCDFYIVGVFDGMDAKSFTGKQLLCPPKNFTNGTLNASGLKEITDHPELSHEPATLILAIAWEKVFSCRSEKP